MGDWYLPVSEHYHFFLICFFLHLQIQILQEGMANLSGPQAQRMIQQLQQGNNHQATNNDNAPADQDDATPEEDPQNELIPEEEMSKLFPTNWTPTEEPYFQYISDKWPPPWIPDIFMKVDIDSVYTYSSSLKDIVKAFGKETRYELPSVTSQARNTTSSRFCVNFNSVYPPPILRGSNANTTPLNWYPNTSLGLCRLKEYTGLDLYINVYFIGAKSFGKNQMFKHDELGVINTMLNMARCLCIDNIRASATLGSEEHVLLQEFYAFMPFETKSGEHTFSKLSSQRRICLATRPCYFGLTISQGHLTSFPRPLQSILKGQSRKTCVSGPPTTL